MQAKILRSLSNCVKAFFTFLQALKPAHVNQILRPVSMPQELKTISNMLLIKLNFDQQYATMLLLMQELIH